MRGYWRESRLKDKVRETIVLSIEIVHFKSVDRVINLDYVQEAYIERFLLDYMVHDISIGRIICAHSDAFV
jgi:hypothetical protein